MITLESRIHGCWLGKSIGGTLGLPPEGKLGPLSFSFYDPIPEIAPPNDDLELQLVWLHLIEQKREGVISREDFARAWLDHIHYMWDEYGRCRWNLRRGVPPAACGTFENWFSSGMGSPIRSEIWACLFPGDPASAAVYAALDASLDHGIEGIAGEVYFAILQSLVLGGSPLEEALSTALGRLPAHSEMARAIGLVHGCHDRGMQVWECWKALTQAHKNTNFTHAPLNVALTVWALLYGRGDFATTILNAVNGGYDTDCTAATAGAIMGMFLGKEGIPEKWSAPIGNGVFVGPGILGIDCPPTLEELTRRTVAQIGKLPTQTWDALEMEGAPAPVELASLPGTITLRTAGGGTVPWANGELPTEIKSSGGATWTWNKADDEPRYLIALAASGAKVFQDGKLLLECPSGLPFVPATHRCPKPARIRIALPKGIYEMRLDLGVQESGQDATLLLTYPNDHIAPWTEEIPNRANLPES